MAGHPAKKQLRNSTEQGILMQVAVVVHVAMTAYQSVIYDWVKATGTLRLSPFDPRLGKSHRHNFAPLNNKCMELRKVCRQ